MKTLTLNILLAASALAATSALGQTRPAATTKPSSTATKPAAKPAAKPATATTAKPAATSAKPAAAKPAAPAAEPAPQAAPAEVQAAAPQTTKSAVSNEFGKGSTAANLGIGFGLGYGYSVFSVNSTPALSLSVERGIIDDIGPGVISVGGLVGYKGYSWKSGSYKGSWKNFLISARGAYHYNVFEVPKLDTYAGISLGVRVESYSDNYLDQAYTSDYGGSYVTSGIFVGGRYMFTDKIGAFSEIGYDMSYLKLGLTARF